MAVLDDVRLKVRRAEEHLEQLRVRVHSTRPIQTYTEQNPDNPREYILRTRIIDSLDPYWGTILGDLMNNCRSAMDYIADAIGVPGGYFPIYDSKPRFVNEAVPNLKRIDPAHSAFIEGLQPCFSTIRPVTDHPGSVLREFTNADKHRLIAVVSMAPATLRLTFFIGGREYPQEPIPVEYSGPLEDKTELARIEIGPSAHDVTVETDFKSTLTAETTKRDGSKFRSPFAIAADGVVGYVRDEVVPTFEPILAAL